MRVKERLTSWLNFTIFKIKCALWITKNNYASTHDLSYAHVMNEDRRMFIEASFPVRPYSTLFKWAEKEAAVKWPPFLFWRQKGAVHLHWFCLVLFFSIFMTSSYRDPCQYHLCVYNVYIYRLLEWRKEWILKKTSRVNLLNKTPQKGFLFPLKSPYKCPG